ncbi:MAG: 4Fe-4S dicluster domain-containing protein [Candidatus Heimdallarchaeota archaeon]
MRAIPRCDQNCRLTCKQCQSCLHNCPTNTIQFEDGFPVIDPEQCQGMSCLICVESCPENALKVVLNDYEE